MHVDHVGLRVEMIIPDVLQQHGAGHDLAGMPHQIFEQAEFARLQLQLLPGAADFVRQPIELEIADPIDRLLAALAGPAGQRLDARQQFGKSVRFCQIIVAAGPQAFDPIVDLAERREDEHRRFHRLAAQGVDDGQAVALRQHAVDDQHVVLAVERHGLAFLAVGRLVGDMADLAERLDQVFGRVAVVLDDEKAHDVLPWSESHAGSASNHIVSTAVGNIDPKREPVRRAAIGRSTVRSLILQNSEGVASSARHPLYPLHPGGGDVCREAELVSSGDGPCGPSPGYARQQGRPVPADRPISQALPSGKATNLVPWPDFTRNKTARLPSLRASARLLRTSAGVDTVLPPTSRMMSPTWKPWSAELPPSATAVTTTPLPSLPETLLAGASVRPSFGTSLAGTSRWFCGVASACFSFGKVPSVSVTVFSWP